jgi:hypothetical protein
MVYKDYFKKKLIKKRVFKNKLMIAIRNLKEQLKLLLVWLVKKLVGLKL